MTSASESPRWRDAEPATFAGTILAAAEQLGVQALAARSAGGSVSSTTMRDLYYGTDTPPTFDDVLARVHQHARLLDIRTDEQPPRA